jgi:hypothetical protein
MNKLTLTDLYNNIYKSIFTITPVFDYSELALKFVELSQAIVDFKGETEEWIYIGEYSECQLDDLLVGAYWHFTNWHNGQSSDSYLALCAIGQIYKPNMECPPSDEEEESEDHESSASCFRLMNAMAEKAKS